MFYKIHTQVGVIALLLITIFQSQSVYAEQNTNLTPAEVKELQMFISKEKNGKAPFAWKKEPLGWTEGFWYQSVIETDGKRITFAYFPESPEPGISFWWRKTGTTSREDLWSSSVQPDGTTSGGSDPGDEHNCHLHLLSEPPIGTEHTEFWQDQANTLIRTALEYYRKK